MKLHMGRPFWPEVTDLKTKYPALPENIKTDVLIIGGGMSGMLSAFTASPLRETVLIDKGSPGRGSTSLNTGLLQYMSDMIYSEMIKRHGIKTARHFYRLSVKAIERIAEIAEVLPEDVGFERKDSFFLSVKEFQNQILRREHREEEKIGLKTELYSKNEIKDCGLNGKSGLETFNDIEINPYKFVLAMAEYAEKNNNLRIYGDTEARSIDFNNKIVRTDRFTVSYNKLIIATGYNFMKEVKKYLRHAELIKTFALITSPVDTQINCGNHMVWTADEEYFYFRKSPEGHIIMGGEDMKGRALNKKETYFKTLKLQETFKKITGIDTSDNNKVWRYSAVFGESDDGLPYAGLHPESEDVFVLHGIGGNGTVCSALSSLFIPDFLNGSDLNEISYLFPGRK